MLARSLIFAGISMLHARMLALMVWPVLAALGLWLALAIFFWGRAAALIDAALRESPIVEWVFTLWPLASFAAHLGWVVLAIVFVPLVLVTATLILGVFAMPVMVNHVAERDYPQLARRRGGGFVGSLWNTVAALLWFAVLGVVTLPLWLLPPAWPVLPVLLLAYLNQRLFAYDALAEHASTEELKIVLAGDRAPLFLLGLIVALLGLVPFAGLLAPLFGGLAFVHYGLARLQAMRTAPIEGVAVRTE